MVCSRRCATGRAVAGPDPAGFAGPLPVVLVRTPYDKVLERTRKTDSIRALAQRGYIVAFQDCAGASTRMASSSPYIDDTDDGYDTVEWIAAQEWCDGNVGMAGGSYVGADAVVRRRRRPAAPEGDRAGRARRRTPSATSRSATAASCCRWASGWSAMGRRSWQMPTPIDLFTSMRTTSMPLPLADVPSGPASRVALVGRDGCSTPTWMTSGAAAPTCTPGRHVRRRR